MSLKWASALLVEKLVHSSLDDEVIIDPSRGHLCEIMLSAKSNLNEF